MKALFLLFLSFLLVSLSFAQVRVRGFTESSFYTLETPAAYRGDFYQAFSLRLLPVRAPQIQLRSYFRVAKLGNDRWRERFYHLNLRWRLANNQLQFTVGRQFVYQGVVNGTLDAVHFQVQPEPGLKIAFLGGVEAPYSRELGLQHDPQIQVMGAYALARISRNSRLGMSYFQKSRGRRIVWQQAGLTLNGKFWQHYYVQGQFEHNLQSNQYQGLRIRLNYLNDPWAVSAEYNLQKPRILEDSYFRIFALEAFQQTRLLAGYLFGKYQVQAQYIFTDMALDQTHQGLLTFSNDWGSLGILIMDGFAGQRLGLLADVRFQLMENLTLRGYSSYDRYQRHSVRLDEDATAFSLGLEYRLWEHLILKADVQESINPAYQNDLRGLFRLAYQINQ